MIIPKQIKSPVAWLATCLCLLVPALHPPQAQPTRGFQAVPEYMRTMKTILLSLGSVDTSLVRVDSVLQSLPDYTRIIPIVPEHNIERVRSSMTESRYGERVSLVPFPTIWVRDGYLSFVVHDQDRLVQEPVLQDTPLHGGTLWAQDLCEAVRDRAGRLLVLTPSFHMYYWLPSLTAPAAPLSDNDYLYSLATRGIIVKKLPFVFSGGNILFDRLDDRTVAFCGGDIFRQTRIVAETFPHEVTDPVFIGDLIRINMGVDEIVAVGERQPALAFHLDQLMMLIGDRRVAVARIAEDLPPGGTIHGYITELTSYLSLLEDILNGLGYDIIPIETLASQALTYRYYTNGIVYTDETNGLRCVLLPVFQTGGDGAPSPMEERNIQRLRDAGLTVITVHSTANELKGGPHCLINVLE